MATVIDNATIETIASLIGAGGKAGTFHNADTFKCDVNDKLNVHEDFEQALLVRGNNVDIDALMSTTPSNAAKAERTALFGSFKRAARKVNGSESDYRLSSVTLTDGATVLCIVRVK